MTGQAYTVPGVETSRWSVIARLMVVALGFAATTVFSSAQSAHAGLLIQNATIVDGTGTDAYSGSIRVEGERITQVGDALAPQQGDVLIDAAGLIVAPGFIDMHAHVSNIHEYPQAENFLRQGVTTIANSLHSHDLPWPLEEYTASLRMAPNIAYFAGFNWTR